MMFIKILNMIIVWYYINNKLINLTINPFLYKNNIILPLTKKKSIYIYPWMLYIIYLYKKYLPYIVRISLRNAFIIYFIKYIYNIRNNKIIKDNPFLEI